MADKPKKPRLLVVTSTYPRWANDTEPAFVHGLASRLTDRFEVVVATSRAPGAKAAEVMDGVHVCRYSYAPKRWETLVYGGGLAANLREAKWKMLLLPLYLFLWALQIARLNHRAHFDVVHAHWFVPGALLAALVLRGTPLCVTAHGSDVLGLNGAIWSRIRRFVAGRASAITAVGTAVQVALDGDRISTVQLVPMGVDLTGTFVPGGVRRTNSLLFVGRLVRAKQPEIALRAFAEVLKRNSSLALDVVGNGPEKHKLELLADQLGIASCVTFHGRKAQEEVSAMYRSSAAVIITSGGKVAPEGLGLVAVEALGCGCSVISVPNVALQALLPHGAPIRYARNNSVSAVAEEVLATLEKRAAGFDVNDTSWREELERRFDWSAIGDKYGNLLESLVESRG